VLAKNSLNSHGVRTECVKHFLELDFESTKPLGQRGIGRCAHDTNVHERNSSADAAIDDSHATPGQPRVYPEHTHNVSYRTGVR
jgi:hypothetical protein